MAVASELVVCGVRPRINEPLPSVRLLEFQHNFQRRSATCFNPVGLMLIQVYC